VFDATYRVTCLNCHEMREFQNRFRSRAQGLDHWQRDADHLDALLADPRNARRLWRVVVYEWDSGIG
jgi:hypothetical protein